MRIPIESIDVGIPKFQWVLGRMSDEVFKAKHGDVYDKLRQDGFPDREAYLDSLEKRSGRYLGLPVLVEKTDSGYRLRDGYHRLAVLAMRRGATEVEAELWRPGWTKKEWECGRLVELLIETGLKLDIVPQTPLIHGDPPYDMELFEEGKATYIDSFMISTGYQVPYILKRADSFEARGDEFTGEWIEKIELLLGQGKHEPILKRWGSQPFNTYLVGHFASGPNAEKDPLVQQYGRFVRIQQYFRAGYWGQDVEGYPDNRKPTVKEQLDQNDIGVPILFMLGALKPGTRVYFADQSADKPCPLNQYFKLFQGKDGYDLLRQYYAWLPTYLRTCRSTDFNRSIEEVIKCIPSIPI